MMIFSTPATPLLFQKCAQANNQKNINAQNQWSFVRGLWLDCCVTQTSQPFESYTKFWIQMGILTNYSCSAVNNTDMTVLCKYITSQWRPRDMASQITGNSTVVFRPNRGDRHQRSALLALCEGNPPVTYYYHYHHFHHYHFYYCHYYYSYHQSLSSFSIIIVITFNYYCHCYFCHC